MQAEPLRQQRIDGQLGLQATRNVAWGLGFQGLGFKGLGIQDLVFKALGFRVRFSFQLRSSTQGLVLVHNGVTAW